MPKDLSPEERLLALIKGKQKKNADLASDQPYPPPSKTGAPDKRAGRIGISEVLHLSIFKNKIFQPALLKSVNIYLLPILITLTVYLAIELLFISPRRDIPSIIIQSSGMPAEPVRVKEKAVAQARDYSYYASEIAAKKIFSPALEEIAKPAQVSKEKEEDAAGNLNLVGIIAGDNPQAIIEDKKNQKTYYLNKGQAFDGFTVENISENRVVLGHKGEQITLVL